jgi:GT2 family glycosyltransferase
VKVSIVIPHFNGLEILKECLASLEKSIIVPDEIIVVDNGSTDDSIDWLKSKKNDIILIQNDQNLGFSKAVNQGICRATSEYTVLLNNDVVVEKNWLGNLIKIMDKKSNLFSCSSKMLRYHDPHIIDDVGDNYTVLGWAYKRGDGLAATTFTESGSVFSACAGAAIYRMCIFNEIGYFDESFFAYLEDIDIGFRALNAGYINYYCADAIVYHIGSATTGSKYNNFKVFLSSRNSVWLIKNNMPPLMILLNMPFLFIGYLTKILFFMYKGYGISYLKGIFVAIFLSQNKHSSRYKGNAFNLEGILLKNTWDYIKFKSKNIIKKAGS